MKLDGRILYLTEDADLIALQLGGEDLPGGGLPLHYGVNTDAMISCLLYTSPSPRDRG